MKRIILTILLALLWLFVASWFYKVMLLLLLAVVWRSNIRALGAWCYRGLVGVLLVALFCTMPRYRLNTSDRVQLVYQTSSGEPRHAPIHHYLANVLLPEEEICNLGIWCARLFGEALPINSWIVDEFNLEVKRGNVRKFTKPYRALNWSGEFLMSGVYSQVFNMLGWKTTQSVHVIKPRTFDPGKSYPVVFFMHGWLGNWKLYQGALKGLEDCIVLSVGTQSWSGIYTKRDINALFTKQIPFLENMGFKVDKNNLHIIGISNGGSASDVAYRHFSRRFKTITFVSTGIHQTFPIPGKVLLVGGGLDHSSGSMPGAYKVLKSNGTKADMYWGQDNTHFIFLVKQQDVIGFLNRQYAE